MEKRDKLLLVFIFSLLAYEILNRPILDMEARNAMNTMEYQILFQSMFGCLVVAGIAIMEIYRDVKQSLNTFTEEGDLMKHEIPTEIPKEQESYNKL